MDVYPDHTGDFVAPGRESHLARDKAHAAAYGSALPAGPSGFGGADHGAQRAHKRRSGVKEKGKEPRAKDIKKVCAFLRHVVNFTNFFG